MKKTMITRIMAAALALTIAFSPVTADAAEKKTVTRDDFEAKIDELCEPWDNGEISEKEFYNTYYDYVASLNGCYNEKGVKIYTVLDGKTKKLTKTSKYDIVVGGKTAKKDQGTIKFVAPKAGTYKFTFSVKNNVTGQNVCIDAGCEFKNMKTDYYQVIDGKNVKTQNDPSTILLAVKGTSHRPASGTYLDRQPSRQSKIVTLSGTIKLKKGQSVVLVCRNPSASYAETSAYRFTDFVVSITKTK